MVRIIPNRLKPNLSNIAGSTSHSRNASPMRNKGDSASPEGRRDTGLVLNAVILRARDLAAKDRSGTSDPYLVLTLGDAKHVTHAVPKDLNPEWNEQAQLPIVGVDGLLLTVCCWDKDRFGKDYLGEFDLALEEIFPDEKTEQVPRWFPLKSKRPGKKTSVVSGEVLLQFTLFDSANKEATPQQVLEKLTALARSVGGESLSRNPTPTLTPLISPTTFPSRSQGGSPGALARRPSDNDEDDDDDLYDDETPEDEDPNKPEAIEKRKRRLRIRGLKRKKRDNPYEFVNGGSDVVGIIFLEICNITDLPPESNLTKTSFDMDPFVVASLGKKTYRTKTLHHNLNPVYNEKMIFQVLGHEQSYSFSFTVIDHDKYSGNDFVASVNLPVKDIVDKSPKADPETGLYNLRDPPEYVPVQQRSRFMRLGLSRTSSAQSLNKIARPPLSKNPSTMTNASLSSQASPPAPQPPAPTSAPTSAPTAQPPTESVGEPLQPSVSASKHLATSDVPAAAAAQAAADACAPSDPTEDLDFVSLALPLKMKNLEKWEDKHLSLIHI